MMFNRRDFLRVTGAAAMASGLPLFDAFGQASPIKVGSVLDNSGNLDI